MGLSNLAAVKLTLADVSMFAEIVDVNRAVDFRSMHCGAGLPEQLRFFRRTLEHQVELLTDQRSLLLAADLLLDRHQLFAAALDFAWRDLVFEGKGVGAFFVGVAKDA